MNYWGIQKQILWLTLLPCLVTAVALGGFFTWEQRQQLVAQANNQAKMLSQQLAIDGAKLFDQDLQSNQDFLRQYLDLPHIRSIALLDTNQAPIFKVGPSMYPATSKRIIESGIQRFETDNSVRILTPIFEPHSDIKDIMYGWIEVEFKTNEHQLLLYKSLLTNSLLIFICSLLAIYLAYRASRRITIPLIQVSDTLTELENGNLDARVHLPAYEEFTELSSGINAMAASLQQAQKELQENVEQATEDLKSTVDSMEAQNIELNIARRSALEASKTKSEFLANMSHEIRTPLNGIIGFSKLLEKTQLSKRQQEYLNTIETSSSSLLSIINDILDFSKIEAGKLVLDQVPMNIRDICDDVLSMLAPEAHKKNIELAAMVYQDVPMDVNGDPIRIKQVITNLVSNAIKFTESGSVVIRVMLEQHIKNNVSLKFTITDTGIGLSESQQQNLFKAFSQGDTSTTRKFGGTGLGLVISKHIVNHMQGEIGLTSQLGAGSQFWFTADIEVCDVEPESWDNAPWFDKIAYLFCQQDTTRQVLLNQLQAVGFHVKTFPSVKAVLDQQMSSKADICFLETNESSDCHTIEMIQRSCKVVSLLLNNEAHNLKIFNQLNIDHRLVYPISTRRIVHTMNELFNGYLQRNLGFLNQKHAPVKVLAVDDNQPNLELLSTWLGDLSVDVVTANGGLQAVEFSQHETFDLIFMDIQMPDLDGQASTERIRQHSQNTETPIVALTAHALPSERKQLLQNGFHDYLTKPISEEQLVRTLMKWTEYQGYEFNKLPMTSTNEVNETQGMQVINWQESLRLAGGKEDLAHKMLVGLIKEASAITSMLDSANIQLLIEPIHKLHGLCKYVGAQHLRECVEQAELCLKTHPQEWFKHKENLLLAIQEVQEWQKNNLAFADLEHSGV